MSAPILYSGFRFGKVYVLNEYGRPASVDENAVAGSEFYGSKAYELTIPGSRRIPHVGNDRLLATQQQPSIEAATGQIMVGAEDLDLIALLSNTVKNTGNVAGLEWVPLMTDKQGSEPNLCMILYQAGLLSSTKEQIYHFHIVLNTTAITIPSGFADSPQDFVYEIAPNPASNYNWGVALTEVADGTLEAGIITGYSSYPPNMAAYTGDGVVVAFLFPLDEQAANVTDVSVFLAAADSANLVEITVGITIAVTGVTWDAAPADGSEIVIVYQKDV